MAYNPVSTNLYNKENKLSEEQTLKMRKNLCKPYI